MTPAHKSKTAGQVVYKDPSAQSLSDYIKAVKIEEQSNQKKLLFHEWYSQNKHKYSFDYEQCHLIWKAAQENM